MNRHEPANDSSHAGDGANQQCWSNSNIFITPHSRKLLDFISSSHQYMVPKPTKYAKLGVNDLEDDTHFTPRARGERHKTTSVYDRLVLQRDSGCLKF